MKHVTTLLLLNAILAVPAQANVAIDKQTIDIACAREAVIANCAGERVGDGLLNCLHGYQFRQLSGPCRQAINRLESEKSAFAAANTVIVSRPAYAIPGPGYIWKLHPRYGWGWYHPRLGWQQGWEN